MCTHCVSLAATDEEMRKLEIIQAHHRRRSKSDAVRFLIETEAEKILSKNVANTNKNVAEKNNDLENS